MTVVGAPPQLYDPDNEPHAWFTMELLLWWLGGFSVLTLAALGVAVYAAWNARRARRLAIGLQQWAKGVDPLIPDRPAPPPRGESTPEPVSVGRHAKPDDEDPAPYEETKEPPAPLADTQPLR